MRNKQAWFDEKVAGVSTEIQMEMQLSASIIARIDTLEKTVKRHSDQIQELQLKQA